MSKKTIILIALAAFALGYYLSRKVESSIIGTYFKPVAV